MNKTILIIICAIVVVTIGGIYLTQNTLTSTTMKIPEDLLYVQINGKIKPYEIPLNAPPSDNEPEYVLVPDKNYPEINGSVQIGLYNVKQLPENIEHVGVLGYFDPKTPDWYYPEQGRTKQVIFVEKIVQLDSVDLGNTYTTQQLRDMYDQLQKEFEDIKEEFTSGKVSQENYISALESLAEHELQLFQDVKEHTFDRDEMTEYNFWHRGVMKFPTPIEQELSKNNSLE
ncbi:MAG: hypothetical protein HKP26_03905 [Nitrosopumilus sp.]|nr:hypothetical protein [Nitrosopumilus sp.]